MTTHVVQRAVSADGPSNTMAGTISAAAAANAEATPLLNSRGCDSPICAAGAPAIGHRSIKNGSHYCGYRIADHTGIPYFIG